MGGKLKKEMNKVIDPNSIYEPSFKRVVKNIEDAISGAHACDGKIDFDAVLFSLKELKAELSLAEHFEYTNEGTFKSGSSSTVQLNGQYGADVKSVFQSVLNHKEWVSNPNKLDQLVSEMPPEFKKLDIHDGDYKVGMTINVEKTRLKSLVSAMDKEKRDQQRKEARATANVFSIATGARSKPKDVLQPKDVSHAKHATLDVAG